MKVKHSADRASYFIYPALFFGLLRSFIFSCLAFAAFVVNAQTQTVEGTVFESQTRVKLPDVSILNLRTKQLVKSDSTGVFRMEAKPDDTLTFKSFTYRTDTLVLANLRKQEVFLTPNSIALDEVKIQDVKTNLGDLRDPEFHGQTVVYQRDDAGFYKGGVAFRISYWNKDSKKVRKFRQRLEKAETLTAIDSLFSPGNIGKLIPLTGQNLEDFIGLYRPSIKDFKDPGFNFVMYLNDCYKKFKDLPPEERKLPPLGVVSGK